MSKTLEGLVFPEGAFLRDVSFDYPYTFVPSKETIDPTLPGIDWVETRLNTTFRAPGSPVMHCLKKASAGGETAHVSVAVVFEGDAPSPTQVTLYGGSSELSQCLETKILQAAVSGDGGNVRRITCGAYIGQAAVDEETPVIEIGENLLTLNGELMRKPATLRKELVEFAIKHGLVEPKAPGRTLEKSEPAKRLLILRIHDAVSMSAVDVVLGDGLPFPPQWELVLQRQSGEQWMDLFVPKVPGPSLPYLSALVEQSQVALVAASLSSRDTEQVLKLPREGFVAALHEDYIPRLHTLTHKGAARDQTLRAAQGEIPFRVAFDGSYKELQPFLEQLGEVAGHIEFFNSSLMKIMRSATPEDFRGQRKKHSPQSFTF